MEFMRGTAEYTWMDHKRTDFGRVKNRTHISKNFKI
jgi:hypothetical protein